jgi:hypothetical protein
METHKSNYEILLQMRSCLFWIKNRSRVMYENTDNRIFKESDKRLMFVIKDQLKCYLILKTQLDNQTFLSRFELCRKE